MGRLKHQRIVLKLFVLSQIRHNCRCRAGQCVLAQGHFTGHFSGVDQPVEILSKEKLAILIQQPCIGDRTIRNQFRKIDIYIPPVRLIYIHDPGPVNPCVARLFIGR